MDLNLLPLARQNGQDQPDPSGLLIATQPRRPARGRQQDRLILYFSMEGNAPLAADQQEQLLKRLAQTYYNTPGSVTAAMRTIAENTNQFMLERNLRGASSGRQSIGLLAVITVRENRLYLAHCGPLQAFLIGTSGVQQFNDPQTTRRGLGLGKVTPIYYAQSELNPNDSLLVSAQPPPGWHLSALGSLYGQGPESLRRRLMAQAGPDLDAILLQARPGSGKSFLMKPRPLSSGSEITRDLVAPEAVSPLVPAPASSAAAMPPALAFESDNPEPDFAPDPAVPSGPAPQYPGAPSGPAVPSGPPVSPSLLPETPAVDESAPTPRPSTRAGAGARRERRAARSSGDQPAAARPAFPLRAALAATGNAFAATLGQALSSLRTFLNRMLPGEGLFTLPVPVMFTTAVAVPLVVVAIASVVYFQRGRAAEYQAYYSKAVQAASFAQAQSDPQTQRTAWIAVVNFLDDADRYGSSDQSKTLRLQALQAYDALNLVQRLDFQPAIAGGLQGGAKIIQLVATPADLYLLDESTGSAWRAFSTGLGYEIDNTFQCGPGFPGSGAIGPLVDIVAVPLADGAQFSLMGIDAAGNALQCLPGESPLFIVLPTPYTGWGNPQAITYDQDELYILDPAKNMMWIYNSKFSDQARPFFTGNSPDLSGVADMAVQKGDLYLLNTDGGMTLCTFTGMTVSPTQCDALPSADSRPGLEGRPYTTESAYLQLAATQPPDPSLYLLEPGAQALHHFSLRLTFQRQLRPVKNLSTAAAGSMAPATAFTLTPDKRVVILAVGGEIFYAGVP